MSRARSARPTRASWIGLSRARFAPANAMQGAVIGEVLRDAEIGIERALLEHDAEQRERRAALARDVAAEDSHRLPTGSHKDG